MERKTYLSIIFATLVISGCTNTQCGIDDGMHHAKRTCVQHVQQDLSTNQEFAASVNEPGVIIRPFEFTGRAWFDTDQAFLRPQAERDLDNLTSQLRQAQARGLITENNKLVIIGHTDSRASRKYNQRLSERRATSVASYLKNKGIPTTSMLAIGKGELHPVASNRTQAGMQQNRRVEIHIEGDSIRVVSY